MKAGTRKSDSSARPRTRWARASSGSLSAAIWLSTRASSVSRRLGPVYDVYAGHALAVEDDAPGRREHPLRDANACFLGEFSNDAAAEIDRLAADVAAVRRAAGKIQLPGAGMARPHFAEQEGAVARAQRRHREAIIDLAVGKAEIAPGEKAREARLEKIRFENASARPRRRLSRRGWREGRARRTASD